MSKNRIIFNNSAIKQKGYSLIEVAFVVGILAIVVIGVLNLRNQVSEQTFDQETKDKMAQIQQALHNFAIANKRLPCPSLGGVAATDANFGEEVTAVTSEFICSINNTDIGSGIDDSGMVPVRTIGLPESYAYDSWGQAFIYRLSQGMMDTKHFISYDYRGDLIVQDNAGVELTSLRNGIPPYNFGASYILLSHGPSGRSQTWTIATPAASRANAADAEAENSNHFLNRIYVKSNHQDFDDILVYDTKEKYLPTITSTVMPHYICENARRFRMYPLDEASPPANVLASVATGVNKAAQITDNICRSYKPRCNTNPSNFNNVVVWLDGNDPNGNGTTAVTGGLATWVNKADNTNNAIKSSGDAPNLLNGSDAECGYGRSCLRFNGSDQFYKLALDSLSGNDFTIFSVTMPMRTGSLRRNHILSYDITSGSGVTNESFMLGDFVGDTLGDNIGSGIYFDAYNRPVATAQLADPFKRKIIVAGLNPNAGLETGLKLWSYGEDGGYLMGANPNSATQLTIAAGTNGRIGNLYNGAPSVAINKYNNSNSTTTNSMYLHELIVYNRSLSDKERMSVVSYLSKKWLQQQCE
ncbi:MAG: type II secretion system protein [Pseudomonadota bacterium]